ncbi:hypothetical protein WMF04_23695 [Sorangium sp. So ce260]
MKHGMNLLVDERAHRARGAALAVRARHVRSRMNEVVLPGSAS